MADVEHQRRRRADHHEDRERDPEEDREGSPEISDVLRHDEQANDARHGAAENQEHRCESHPAADQEPRQGDVDQRHVLLLRQLVDHPVDVVAEEEGVCTVHGRADARVRTENERGVTRRVAEQVVPDELLGPLAVDEVVHHGEVTQQAAAEGHQLPRPVQEQLHPEELDGALRPALHRAQVVRVHLGDAGADRLLHVHAALAPAEVLVRGGGVFDLGARLEVFEIDGLVGLPAEVHRVDLPHRVGPARGHPAAPVSDDVHDVEGRAVEDVQHVAVRRQAGEVLRRLHHGDVAVWLVGEADVLVLHELGQHHAPEIRVGHVTGVEDTEQHALGNGILLRARADEAVAELQHVDREVQAATLPAHADVRHEKVPLDEDCGVAVHQAAIEVHHGQARVQTGADLLDDLAVPVDLHGEVYSLLILGDCALRQQLRHLVTEEPSQVLAKRPLERLRIVRRPIVFVVRGEEELQAGVGCHGHAH
mmetsp:Transcript_128951/g.345862  ORF Transcript_128951/g.345862 Transcript_128951/m.345862 type:complete len:479 (+) Transcript_128951:1437-2873(+)